MTRTESLIYGSLIVVVALWSAAMLRQGAPTRPVVAPVITQELRAEPRSACWRKVRAAYIAEHPECEYCGDEATQVHHLLPFHLRPELECEPSNLLSVCEHCHLRFAHAGDFKAYNPHAKEDAALMRKRRAERLYE